MASQQPLDASHLLPLTDLAFNILVALTDRELHGYALIKEYASRPWSSGLCRRCSCYGWSRAARLVLLFFVRTLLNNLPLAVDHVVRHWGAGRGRELTGGVPRARL